MQSPTHTRARKAQTTGTPPRPSQTPPHERPGFVQCCAHNRNGKRCKRGVLKGATNGKCNLHGGRNPGRPPINGNRTSENGPTRTRIRERAAEFERLADPLNLSRELAMMRAIMVDWCEQYDAEPDPQVRANLRGHATIMLDKTGTMIERVERIRSATALTQAEVKYLYVKMAGLMTKYIPDKAQREAFKAELKEVTGARDDSAPTVPVLMPGQTP